MKNIIIIILMTCLIAAFAAGVSFAAVGCTLNDPDRDIRRIFPQSSGYTTRFVTIEDKGGESLLKEIEKKLGDSFDLIYETPDVPYAYYTVLEGKEVVGFVHGVNQKGKYGGLQLILATDLDGKILSLYYQRISSPEAKVFRDETFTDQFKGLMLKDFILLGSESDSDHPLARIQDPSQKSLADFTATLRGLKKNLILLDVLFSDHKIQKGK